MNPAPLVSQFAWDCIGGLIVIAGDVAVVKTIAAAVAPAPEPPQSTSGSVVMSQMAIRGSSVVMSASNVPLSVSWGTIGGKKKKPAAAPARAASEKANCRRPYSPVGL